MPFFSNKFQKTGFLLSLMLSFIYLPLVIGILQTNNFIYNHIFDLIIFISFTISFITVANYKIMLTINKEKVKFVNRFLLLPFNILIMFLIFFFLPFDIEKNVFYFSLLFLGIPWSVYFFKIYKRHTLVLKRI